MRYATIGTLLAMIFAGQMGLSQEKGEKKKNGDSEIKSEFSYLQKTWGLMVKTIELVPPPAEGNFVLKVSFEFEKNLEAKELKVLLSLVGNNPVKHPLISCQLFDGDNILIVKYPLMATVPNLQGAVSGVKGDVFRVNINSINTFPQFTPEYKARLKKIAFRLEEKLE